MANVDRPNGAVPVRRLDGGAALPANLYSVDVTNATAIFIGDFVTMETDGSCAPASAGTGNLILGVCMGVADDYGNLARVHLPATTAGNIFVQDDPYCIFEIQDDAAAVLTQAAVGANAPIVAGGGDTTTGISAHELGAGGVTSAIEQLRILRLVRRADNAWGNWGRVEVLINEHFYNTVDAAGI
jgi:hypothetical protein